MTAAPVIASPRERPILFSAPMILAILDGRKTVTRRLKSDYRVGDLLYVRETWATPHSFDGDRPSEMPSWARVHYRATWEGPCGLVWRPSIHMPKWASRIWIEVTGVRKERLQDITRASAIAEGLKRLSKDGGITCKYGIPDRDGMWGTDDYGWPWRDWDQDPRVAFSRLWDGVNGKGAWASNPTVHVIEFRRVR